MDSSFFLILLLGVLVALTVGTIAYFRSGRNTLRRDRGVPTLFGMDPTQNNPGSSDANQLHHHHHHSSGDAGHHHSHGGADAGGSHHSGGSDGGGSAGGGHH